MKSMAGKRKAANCSSCGKETTVSVKWDSTKAGKEKGKKCAECLSELYSITMTNTRAIESKEERSERGKKGNHSPLRNNHAALLKQWETIRANPALQKKISDAKSAGMKEVWASRSADERTERIKKCFLHGKPSAMCLKMKEMMLAAGLTGFSSEEYLSGFIPDEINHELKIIVEFYGDYYHCNPILYSDSGVYISAISRTVGEQWKRDEGRLACFYKLGYVVVIVWEHDFKLDPELQIKRIIETVEKRKLQ